MEKYTLLLIDDEENILNALERSLHSPDFHLIRAANPQEAQELLAKQKIDLVICDYQLEKTSGLDLLEKISKEHPKIITILMTGHVNFDMAVEAINRSVVNKFILKPWDNIELMKVVRDELEGNGLSRLKEIKAGDIMSRFAITIEEDATILKVSHLMMRFKISGLPVVNKSNKIVGVITATDLFNIMGGTVDNNNKIFSENKLVQHWMIKEVYTVEKSTTFLDVIKIMTDKKVHTLPVMEGTELIGVIGRRDVIYNYYKLFE